MRTYFVDGRYVDAENAMIPVDDLAVLRGFGVCDIIRTFDKKPYLLKEHIQRLEKSAIEIGLKLPWSKKEIAQIIIDTLEKNRLDAEANIRIVVTGGSSTDFFYPQDKPRLIVLITDLKPLPSEWYTNGIKVITRHEERSVPGAKVISYIPAALAMKEAQKKGAVESIYVNPNNEVMEGTTSNLFMVINGTLITPKEGVLNGVTRQAVISLAKNICPVKQDAISLKQFLNADEIFITGTNKGIVPVVQVDGKIIGTGKPGEVTKKLMAALDHHSKTCITEV